MASGAAPVSAADGVSGGALSPGAALRRNAFKPGFEHIDWSTPWFAQFATRGVRWQQAALGSEAALLAEMNTDAGRSGQTTGRGKRLAFIAQDDLPVGSAYEAHIASTGCVPTRHNLHDFFNALVWFQ
ncbi:MAG TPA: DUF3025 domain-containing protein, partial [Paraburkholderia sp.]|nr:DUF3025 domain-containing protein [Paraburkholderia sp.]